MRHCFRPKQDLLRRYGGLGTWALVTGASDGVGREHCKQLARDGFNIVLVSRKQSRLNKVAKEVREIAPDVKTRVVEANFYNNANLNFYRDVVNKVSDLDIGLVVLNAAVFNIGYMETKRAE